MFKSVRKNLRPLFGQEDEPKPQSGSLEYFAHTVPISLGLAMMVSQGLNEGMRHCSIGNVTMKPNAR